MPNRTHQKINFWIWKDFSEFLTQGLIFDFSSPILIDKDHFQLTAHCTEFEQLSV